MWYKSEVLILNNIYLFYSLPFPLCLFFPFAEKGALGLRHSLTPDLREDQGLVLFLYKNRTSHRRSLGGTSTGGPQSRSYSGLMLSTPSNWLLFKIKPNNRADFFKKSIADEDVEELKDKNTAHKSIEVLKIRPTGLEPISHLL